MYTKYNKKTWVYFTADPGKNKKLNYEKKNTKLYLSAISSAVL